MTKERQEQYNTAVAILKEKEMTAIEITRHFGLKNSSRLTSVLLKLSNDYPLYEPSKNHYKILTDKDMEKYNGRNDMA